MKAAREHSSQGWVTGVTGLPNYRNKQVVEEFIESRLPQRLRVISGALRGMTSTAFDLDLIFPIRNVASADLIDRKSTCLWNAGIIDDRQRKLVQQRAARFSAGATRSL